jgi:uncharacterized membrane protein YbaN (DUF454 family)
MIVTNYLKKSMGYIKVRRILSGLKRVLLIFAGIFFMGIGIIGIFLPLLPTTVFLLLAAYCFARSSERFYSWLLNNKWFGSFIKNYREKKGITLRTKIFTISILWITILYSAIFLSQNFYVRIFLLLIASGVTAHLLTIRTFRSAEAEAEFKQKA